MTTDEIEFDYSYSGIVKNIQHDNKKALDWILHSSGRLLQLNSEKHELTERLHTVNTEIERVKSGNQHVAKHMKFSLPLFFSSGQNLFRLESDGSVSQLDNFVALQDS